jgi:prepilin-type N-terminal cleavage/methylation domain-containing protein
MPTNTVAEDMQTEPVLNRPARRTARGFTLIEVMIAMAIIGILAAVALPSYRQYILRGQLVDATTLLATQRGNMERYFQDNRTYAVVGTIYPPCHANIAAAQRTQGNFVVSCTGTDLAATTFTLTATGSGPVNGFTYTVNQLDNRATPAVGATGWSTSTTCWVVKKGQVC